MCPAKKQKQNYRNLTSRFAGRVSNLKKPKWSVSMLIHIYRKKYKINMSDFIVPSGGFKSFNSFFTRNLMPGVRKIDEGIVSPVDGTIFDAGVVDPDNKIFVKHKFYYIDDLLCGDFEDLKSYAVLYLSPADYHRVHACFDMEIDRAVYLPGTLLSVRKKTVYKKDMVYCRNERIVLSGTSPYGRFYFILVGALMVGKVKLSFDSGLQTNIKRGVMASKEYLTPVQLKKGDETGYFEMGSSVLILLEDNCLAELSGRVHEKVRMGQKLV
jgi:phosphatidylserine decarboxylase